MSGSAFHSDLIIFDCDGVLVDSEPISARCLAAALVREGLTIETAEIYRLFLGRSMPSVVAGATDLLGRPPSADFVQRLRADTMAALECELRPVPGVAEALTALDHLPRCVASSSQMPRILLSLRVTGLLPVFTPDVFSADQVSRGKPAPDLFLFAAERMGRAPGRCLVVEDSVAGVQAAAAAGMTVWGFVGGSHMDPERDGPRLAEAGAARVFDRMSALPALLGVPSALSG